MMIRYNSLSCNLGQLELDHTRNVESSTIFSMFEELRPRIDKY